MKFRVLAALFLFAWCMRAQDTSYARSVINKLTSKKCFGRGYVRDGLVEAQKIIINEIRQTKAVALFGESFLQPFSHPVNTFSRCRLSVNGKTLRAGTDFIPHETAPGLKGKFKIRRLDSVTYAGINKCGTLKLSQKKKLTFSVAAATRTVCELQLAPGVLPETPVTAVVDIRSKVITDFRSSNIGCMIRGTSGSDSMIVFSAHYDHLGGIDDNVFFPGANDNASGVSMVLSLLKYYNTHQPAYNMVFVFFAGEEAGLVGSKYFTSAPTFDLLKIRFLINLDLLGTGDDGIMVVNGAILPEKFSQLEALNARLNLVKEIRKRGKAANSDHYWFTEAGVPAFFIYTMGGVTAYHDVNDIASTLPLTDFTDVMELIKLFAAAL